jgi:hypothetical protein
MGGGEAQKRMKAQQRQSLADFAREKGELDQQQATGARRRGKGLLTFLAGEGAVKFGQAG